jgi:putative flippase GtrA
MLCAGVSYVLNLLMLWTALDVLMLQPVIAQVVAVASYTISFYLLNRYVVFASHPA